MCLPASVLQDESVGVSVSIKEIQVTGLSNGTEALKPQQLVITVYLV